MYNYYAKASFYIFVSFCACSHKVMFILNLKIKKNSQFYYSTNARRKNNAFFFKGIIIIIIILLNKITQIDTITTSRANLLITL